MYPVVQLAGALQHAYDFVRVAATTCQHLRTLGLDGSVLILLASNGRPMLTVDDLRDVRDSFRLEYVRELWSADPFLAALRQRHLPVTEERCGWGAHVIASPIVEPTGVFGAVICTSRAPIDGDLQQSVVAMIHHVTVRLTQLGLRCVSETVAFAQLTDRQIAVARLAASGDTNLEISEKLRISENTVKKHLKDIFERLQISNRIELAAAYRHLAPREEVPFGITHRGAITIVRTT